ncbi:sugar phosphate isomerase/epimerase [Sphingobacterium siyangense]|uniref:sugar phosphate isomerase/epimerase family protein n=1 Tax=Sphingobacterium TaxID=28453 RepID=UPI000958699D|nr:MULTISPECIES: sugar phosphate isomerase/epimerase family protein [Sphingobacterium]APU99300.1 endonuclease [Sphingobacterium sp. B29]UQA74977.1 sugar phosphate isomerase/epimerase [Sphingobacterium siyangense]
MMNRKKFICDTLALIGVAALPSAVFAAPKQRYNVAVIDLMILKRQKLSAFDLAKEIGADGLEVDMGGLGNRITFDSKLGDPAQRKAFLDKAKETGITICSLAMTGFYAQSFATRPTYQQMVGDCLDTCQKMGVKVAFLPLGVTCDLVKYPELRPAIVERLRIVGEMAKKAGVIIGIETALDAKAEVELLKEIGSKHIQIYFNFSNPLKEGRDLIQELTILGKKRICQIHCTDEDGVWLENNKRLHMPLVKRTLDRMGWRGWLVIERSRDANLSPRAVKENFGANTRYVKQVFQ